jgi:hypothetical protein
MASTAIHHGAAVLELAPLIVTASASIDLGRENMNGFKANISIFIKQLHRIFCCRGRDPSASLISLF